MAELFIHLEDQEQFGLITKYAKVCVVDFYTEWCGPCKQLSKSLNVILGKKYREYMLTGDSVIDAKTLKDKLVVLKIDADKFEDLSQTFNVECFPFITFFKNGVLQEYKIKGNDPAGVMKIVNKLLGIVKAKPVVQSQHH